MVTKIIDNPKWEYGTERSVRIVYNLPLQAEFKCDNCGHQEIHIRGIREEEIEWLAEGKLESSDCPKCQDAMIVVLPNNPVLILTNNVVVKEWVCPRCARRNSHKNEVCMGAEMGDGRCGYLRPEEEHETDSDGNLLGLG